MSKRILQRLFSRAKVKPFSAWQIELTTRCPLRCRMCIREEFKDWYGGDMNINDFKRLVPYFKNVETIILEGWGESLLYENLIEVIRLVKGAEGFSPEGYPKKSKDFLGTPEVGFVTGGKGLDRGYISKLITAGVDFIGFSLAGATSRAHNSIRVNSDLDSLLDNIRDFVGIKADKKLKKPRLHIVYLMLKDNIFEVPALLKLGKEIGIEEVVLTNLIHVTNEWQERQRVFRCAPLTHPSPLRGEGKGEGYEEILKEAEKKARELKINLRRPSLSSVEVAVCKENPLKNLYISVDGEISPCVYLYPPTSSPFKRIFCGDEHHLEKVSFGNIFKEPFSRIWNSRGYTEFRDSFIQRKRRLEEMYSYLRDMEKLRGFNIIEPLPEPPEHCRTCHKMLGV